MPGRNGENDLVASQGLEDERPLPAAGAHDPELDLARGDALDHGLGVPDGEGDVELGMPALELAEEERDEVGAGPGGRTDGERAGEPAAVGGGDVFDQLLFELEHALGAPVQPHPRLGRLDAPAGAVEKLLPEALLERAHLQADCGLRHPEPLGRLREAPPLDDRAEGRKLSRVHKENLYLDSACGGSPATRPPLSLRKP
jgi:hypothetical protein